VTMDKEFVEGEFGVELAEDDEEAEEKGFVEEISIVDDEEDDLHVLPESVRGLKLEPVFTMSEVPKMCLNGVPCCIGIDEAGRGPVLGSMVYGLAYWPVSEKISINELGFNDSKQLTEADRARYFKLIKKEKDRIGNVICDLSASYISASMMARDPVSLNAISHSAAIEMVERIIAKGVNVMEIYVDAVGNCEWYQKRLEKKFPLAKVVVKAKADALFKVVGAASIFAKVTRDENLKKWRFRELYDDKGQVLKRKRKFTTIDCSGYPSDEKTIKWLKANTDKIFGFPSIVRFSWKTARNLLGEYDDEMDLEEKKKILQLKASGELPQFVTFEWETEHEKQGMLRLDAIFKQVSRPKRTKYFVARRLQPATSI